MALFTEKPEQNCQNSSNFTQVSFSKLFAIAEVMNLTKEEKMAYDASLKEKRDNYSTMKYAIMEGEEKGRQEEKIQIAKEMKRRGLAISLISDLTGLALEVVNDLV